MTLSSSTILSRVKVRQYKRLYSIRPWYRQVAKPRLYRLPPRRWSVGCLDGILDESGLGDQDENVVDRKKCAGCLPVGLGRHKTYLDDRRTARVLQRTCAFFVRCITRCDPVYGVRIVEEQLERVERWKRPAHQHGLFDPQCRQQDVRWECHVPIPGCKGTITDI